MTNATLAKLVLTGVVAVGGGGFLVYSSVGQAQHYMQVDQLAATKAEDWKDKELKVHGHVVAGSIVEEVLGSEMQRTFLLENGGKKVRVFSKGPKPDTFKDESEVVALGVLVPAKDRQGLADSLCEKAKAKGNAACPVHTDADQAYIVDASELSAKCPSRYAEGTPNNKLDPTYK
jgi:cytochrome c-type biogenesis protein CcmE